MPAGLIAEVDEYIKESKGAFTSRADFVKAAIREKLKSKEETFIIRDLIKAIEKSPEIKKAIKKGK